MLWPIALGEASMYHIDDSPSRLFPQHARNRRIEPEVQDYTGQMQEPTGLGNVENVGLPDAVDHVESSARWDRGWQMTLDL